MFETGSLVRGTYENRKFEGIVVFNTTKEQQLIKAIFLDDAEEKDLFFHEEEELIGLEVVTSLKNENLQNINPYITDIHESYEDYEDIYFSNADDGWDSGLPYEED